MEKLQQLQELRDQSNLLKKEIENYKRRSRELWEETDVGGRYYNARLENFDPKGYEDQFEQIVKYAKKFDQTKGKGLILLGSPGTGKTYLAAAVGHHVVEHFGMSVWFKSWPELLQQIKNSYNGGGLTQDVIDCLLGVDLLVIDDFGKGQTTEWAQEQLYTVVNGRYRDMKPVIITTNYNLPTLREIINPAVISRLDQMCMKIRMVGPDYRLKKEAV